MTIVLHVGSVINAGYHCSLGCYLSLELCGNVGYEQHNLGANLLLEFGIINFFMQITKCVSFDKTKVVQALLDEI